MFMRLFVSVYQHHVHICTPMQKHIYDKTSISARPGSATPHQTYSSTEAIF